MQVEEDPSSQFVDFTNATDSEQFVSDVEQALLGWQLANKGNASLEALGASNSTDDGEPIFSRKTAFKNVQKWFGVDEFLLLMGQDEAGMLLSAMSMALNNCNCTIPAFVPVFEPSRGSDIDEIRRIVSELFDEEEDIGDDETGENTLRERWFQQQLLPFMHAHAIAISGIQTS
eukprot:jgi/Phyca11/533260/estExt2_fgenesh1_pg.C_PHYCAscaffold_120026